jgi:hypothetical protein
MRKNGTEGSFDGFIGPWSNRVYRGHNGIGLAKVIRFRMAPQCVSAKPSRHRVRMRTRPADILQTIFISFLFLTLSHVAEATDHGQFGPTSPEIKAWANSLENKLSEGCCSTADGWKPEEVEYDMTGNKYRVKIEGEWYDVPRDALVEVPNRFGFPVVWYYKTWDNGIRPSISIRCFIPGAGG